MDRHTFRGRESEPVFARRSFGQPVAVTEHVRMQLFELYRVGTDTFHPVPASNVLCNEGSPDGYGVHWTSTSSSFETHAARIFIIVDTESM